MPTIPGKFVHVKTLMTRREHGLLVRQAETEEVARSVIVRKALVAYVAGKAKEDPGTIKPRGNL